MTKIEGDKFKRRLARRLGQAALRKARPRVSRSSETLARSMQVNVFRLPGRLGTVQASVHIPHYWAVYVHDGRRPFRKGRYMVWWRNPKLDPRLQNGKSPRRARNVRRLTRDQFLAAMALRDEWIKQGGDPFDAPVIITKAIRKPTRPNTFFSNEPAGGMFGFRDIAGRIAQDEMSRFVKDFLGDSFSDSLEIRVKL